MKASKISYSISRSMQIFNSPSDKYKYKKIASQLETFYKEGSKDREAALSLRDEVIAKNNFRYNKNSVENFFCLLGVIPNTAGAFIKYCNSYSKLRKFFNLE